MVEKAKKYRKYNPFLSAKQNVSSSTSYEFEYENSLHEMSEISLIKIFTDPKNTITVKKTNKDGKDEILLDSIEHYKLPEGTVYFKRSPTDQKLILDAGRKIKVLVESAVTYNSKAQIFIQKDSLFLTEIPRDEVPTGANA